PREPVPLVFLTTRGYSSAISSNGDGPPVLFGRLMPNLSTMLYAAALSSSFQRYRNGPCCRNSEASTSLVLNDTARPTERPFRSIRRSVMYDTCEDPTCLRTSRNSSSWGSLRFAIVEGFSN